MSYNDKKHIRVSLPASQLRELISKHPEVEVELLRHAIPQVTEEMKRRAINGIVDHLIARTKSEIGRASWDPGSVVKAMIDKVIADRMTEALVKKALEATEARIGKQVDDWFKKHEPRITEIIATRIGLVVDEIIRLKK